MRTPFGRLLLPRAACLPVDASPFTIPLRPCLPCYDCAARVDLSTPICTFPVIGACDTALVRCLRVGGRGPGTARRQARAWPGCPRSSFARGTPAPRGAPPAQTAPAARLSTQGRDHNPRGNPHRRQNCDQDLPQQRRLFKLLCKLGEHVGPEPFDNVRDLVAAGERALPCKDPMDRTLTSVTLLV